MRDMTTASEHPLWETQVHLEREMMLKGRDNFSNRVVRAKEKNTMTALKPVRGLMQDWLPACADHLRRWIRGTRSGGGPKPIALAYLKDCDPYVACFIALREVLDRLTTKEPKVTALAVRIGVAVEHEMQVRHWEKNEPKLYHAQQREFAKHGSTAPHQSRVNINIFNNLLAASIFNVSWEKWSAEVHWRVGMELLNVIMHRTGWFVLASDPNYIHRKGSKASGPPLVIAPKPELLEWLAGQLDYAEVASPVFLPTVIPPKRWEGTRNGGYWTPYINTPRMIRFKAQQQEQQERAADEYDALDMPMVYDAVHFIQETPWRVNQKILSIAATIEDLGLGIAGIRSNRPLERPIKPADFEQNYEAAKKWRIEAAKAHAHNAKLFSQLQAAERTLNVAKEYSAYECFYFPQMLDFRSRMYALAVALQPQGDDLARGLLELAEGKAVDLDNGGARWLAIHVASCWGIDKCSFSDRVAWVKSQHRMLRAIALDPLKHRAWVKCDKPFQALAATLDYVGFLKAPKGTPYVSHMPVYIDGTCNGIQHLAAMTRDEVAGEHVNLIPGDRPKDIYKFIAGLLQEKLERIELAGGLQGEYASYWLNLCNRDLPRGLTKRPVMVLPYGGTKDAFYKYIREWLDESDPVKKDSSDTDRELRTKRLSLLVNHLWDTVGENIKGPRVVMKWLRDCAQLVAHRNQPIFWATASGFVVRHFYGAQKVKTIESKLDGQRVQLKFQEYTKDLDKHSQLLGIAPNFVHSMDAACLHITINKAKSEGRITAFTAVHDAYGTHAADMDELARLLRESFVELYSTDVLAGFRDSCLRMLRDELMVTKSIDYLEASEQADEMLPQLPPMGSLNIQDVLKSEYFFA